MRFARASAFVLRLWFSVAAAILILVVLVAVAIDASRGRHEEQETLDAWSVARVLESDLEGLFSEASLALLAMADAWDRHLRGEANLAAVSFHAVQARATVPDFDLIRVVDAAGTIVAGSSPVPAPAVSVADRRYFIDLRDRPARPGQPLAIDGPVAERLTGQDVLVFARRLDRPDGGFGGIAVAAVSTERMARMFRSAKIGALGEIVLYGEDLRVLARHPPPAGPPTDRAGEAPPELRAALASGEAAGSFRHAAAHDGLERNVSFRRVARFPAFITVTRAPADYLAHWRRDAAVTLSLAVLLAMVAAGTGTMLHGAWLKQQAHAEQLSLMARTDELTGLPNRRAFFESAEAERARAVRYGSELAVLMIDIDHFKAVNDTYGHRAGDLVLQHLGQTCIGVLRGVDVLGRVGGEEFAVLLPETGLPAAAEVAGRLRAAVEEARVALPEGAPLRITVSVGVAGLQGEETLDTLVSRADTALYEAKRGGRNCVRVLAGTGPPWTG